MAVKPMDQRVRETIGAQAWQLLLQQQQIEEQAAKIAALEAELAALKPTKPKSKADA